MTLRLPHSLLAFLLLAILCVASTWCYDVRETAPGFLQIDAAIPGGAYDYATQSGWKSNPSRTRWSYRNGLGGVQGIVKLSLKISSTPGLVQLSASGRNGSYTVARSGIPVHVTLAVDSSAGQCGEASFAGPPPSPSCAFSSSGRALGCK